MRINLKNPTNAAEWQEAVNAANYILLIDSALQYGLIETDMEYNLERAIELVNRGAELGYMPER